MALFIRQDDERSELQQRLAAELQDRAKKRADIANTPPPDGVTDSNYLRDTQTTSKFAWIWILLTFLICVAILGFIVFT